jgi:hypothetical protein
MQSMQYIFTRSRRVERQVCGNFKQIVQWPLTAYSVCKEFPGKSSFIR